MKRLPLRTISAVVCGLAAPFALITPAHADTPSSSDPDIAGSSVLEPGSSTTLKSGETVTIADKEKPIAIDSYSEETPAPKCITRRESKGFLQVTNSCQMDIPIKVHFQHGDPSGCETVKKGTTHNHGFIGVPGLNHRKVDHVVIC